MKNARLINTDKAFRLLCETLPVEEKFDFFGQDNSYLLQKTSVVETIMDKIQLGRIMTIGYDSHSFEYHSKEIHHKYHHLIAFGIKLSFNGKSFVMYNVLETDVIYNKLQKLLDANFINID